MDRSIDVCVESASSTTITELLTAFWAAANGQSPPGVPVVGVAAAVASSHPHAVVRIMDDDLGELRQILIRKNLRRDLDRRDLRIHVAVESADHKSEATSALARVGDMPTGKRLFLWSNADDLGESRPATAGYFGLRAKVAAEIIGPDPAQIRRQLEGAILGASSPNSAESPMTKWPEVSDESGPAFEAVLLRYLEPIAARLEAAASTVEVNLRAGKAGQSPPFAEGMSAETAAGIVERVTQALTQLERRLAESAEQRFAARLDAMADAWTQRVRENIVEASSQFIARSNAAFGTRAEHFVQRLDLLVKDELGRDKRFEEAARHGTATTLRQWLEPRLDVKNRWFAAGAVACFLCMVAGLAIGLAIPRIVG